MIHHFSPVKWWIKHFVITYTILISMVTLASVWGRWTIAIVLGHKSQSIGAIRTLNQLRHRTEGHNISNGYLSMGPLNPKITRLARKKLGLRWENWAVARNKVRTNVFFCVRQQSARVTREGKGGEELNGQINRAQRILKIMGEGTVDPKHPRERIHGMKNSSLPLGWVNRRREGLAHRLRPPVPGDARKHYISGSMSHRFGKLSTRGRYGAKA